MRHLHRTEEREVHLPCKVEYQRGCMGPPKPLYLLYLLYTCYVYHAARLAAANHRKRLR